MLPLKIFSYKMNVSEPVYCQQNIFIREDAKHPRDKMRKERKIWNYWTKREGVFTDWYINKYLLFHNPLWRFVLGTIYFANGIGGGGVEGRRKSVQLYSILVFTQISQISDIPCI